MHCFKLKYCFVLFKSQKNIFFTFFVHTLVCPCVFCLSVFLSFHFFIIPFGIDDWLNPTFVVVDDLYVTLLTVDVMDSRFYWQLMFLTVDVLEVDVLVVDVLELDVLGAHHFTPTVQWNSILTNLVAIELTVITNRKLLSLGLVILVLDYYFPNYCEPRL